MDPRGLTPGPGLSLQGGPRGAEGSRGEQRAAHVSVRCFRTGSAASPSEPSPSLVPSPGSQREQCESLGSQCRASSLGTQTMAAMFLCLQAPMQLIQKPPLCPLGQAKLKSSFFNFDPTSYKLRRCALIPKAVIHSLDCEAFKGVSFLWLQLMIPGRVYRFSEEFSPETPGTRATMSPH